MRGIASLMVVSSSLSCSRARRCQLHLRRRLTHRCQLHRRCQLAASLLTSPSVSTYRIVVNFIIRMIVYDEYSGSMKITSHLDHVSHCKTASGTNWSNRWTSRVSMINTRPNEIPLAALPTEKQVESGEPLKAKGNSLNLTSTGVPRP